MGGKKGAGNKQQERERKDERREWNKERCIGSDI